MRIFTSLTILVISITLTSLFFSCSQQEGIGGNSHIKGKIMVNYYNDDFSPIFSDQLQPAKDEDVYLIFGDDSIVGEDTKTSFTGDFEFEYLWPGNYKLYYYSDDTTGKSSEPIEIVKEFTLEKNQTLELNDLIISKRLKWDEGNSFINGKIFINYYNDDFSLLLSDEPVPAKDEDVFLIFGKDNVVSDDTKTSFTGDFGFENLWQGTYKLYCLSEDTTGLSTEPVEIVKEITLKEYETVKIDSLIINKSLQWDEGTSSIKGTVYLTNYNSEGNFKDRTPAQEQEIYITYGNHPFYDERVRTSSDGTFMFKNLIKGKYHIFLYSEDLEGGTAYKVVDRYFEITEEHQDIVLKETIEIYKL